MVLWFYGFMVLWFYGFFMVLWFYGFFLYYGFMVLWGFFLWLEKTEISWKNGIKIVFDLHSYCMSIDLMHQGSK